MFRRQTWRLQSRSGAGVPVTGQQLQLDVLAIVRRWRTLVVLGSIGLVVGLVMTLLMSAEYRASAVFFVGGRSGTSVEPVYANLEVEVRSNLDAFGSAAVERRAAERLGEPAAVTIRRLDPDSAAIRLDAEADTPQRAVEVIDAYLAAFEEAQVAQELAGNERVQAFLADRIAATEEELNRLIDAGPERRPPEGIVAALEGQLRRYVYDLQSLRDTMAFLSVSPISMLDPPMASDEALGRPLARNGALGALIGVIAGMLVVLIRRDAGWTFETSGELENLTGLPTLGTVPAAVRRPLPGGRWAGRDPEAARAFVEMRSLLYAACADDLPVALQITGSRPGVGTTTVVENLGATFAAAGIRVLLVDLNLRHPRLHRRFGVPLRPGFGDLVGPDLAADGPLGVPVSAAVRHVAPNLAVLSAGTTAAQPGALLASVRAGDVLRELVNAHDVVLVDSPAVLGVADAREVAGLVSASVMVVGSRGTEPQEVVDAVNALTALEARVLGLVVNRLGGSAARWSQHGRTSLSRITAAVSLRSH